MSEITENPDEIPNGLEDASFLLRSIQKGKYSHNFFTTKGFQSGSEPIIHFGYGNAEIIDSLLVIWPDNSFQKLENIKPNQSLVISQEKNSDDFLKVSCIKSGCIFRLVPSQKK